MDNFVSENNARIHNGNTVKVVAKNSYKRYNVLYKYMNYSQLCSASVFYIESSLPRETDKLSRLGRPVQQKPLQGNI